jgi:hypothetical protein
VSLKDAVDHELCNDMYVSGTSHIVGKYCIGVNTNRICKCRDSEDQCGWVCGTQNPKCDVIERDFPVYNVKIRGYYIATDFDWKVKDSSISVSDDIDGLYSKQISCSTINNGECISQIPLTCAFGWDKEIETMCDSKSYISIKATFHYKDRELGTIEQLAVGLGHHSTNDHNFTYSKVITVCNYR